MHKTNLTNLMGEIYSGVKHGALALKNEWDNMPVISKMGIACAGFGICTLLGSAWGLEYIKNSFRELNQILYNGLVAGREHSIIEQMDYLQNIKDNVLKYLLLSSPVTFGAGTYTVGYGYSERAKNFTKDIQ